MIRRPRPGQQVRLRYRPSLRTPLGPYPAPPHLAEGTVVTVARGPRTLNALVRLTDGRLMVVPHGHLEAR
jgi:hypothetical protein